MTPAEREELQREYAAAAAAGRAPDFSQAPLTAWIKVADRLVEGGELELASFAVRQLHAVSPDFMWARNLAALFECMPPADPGAPRFADDFPKAVQVARREGAETVLVVFCGAAHRVGMPVPMLHRWLSRLPVSLIYLRDLKGLCYLGGVEGLGEGLTAAVAGLAALAEDLGARRIVCYGVSVGGYGALRYGLELGADAVLGMGALVNMTARFNRRLHYADAAERVEAAATNLQLDLTELYRTAPRPPRTKLVFGAQNWDDRIHAECMAGLDGVTLAPIEGYRGHNAAAELIHAGGFEALLEQAVLA